jgi:hypothetical protein
MSGMPCIPRREPPTSAAVDPEARHSDCRAGFHSLAKRMAAIGFAGAGVN